MKNLNFISFLFLASLGLAIPLRAQNFGQVNYSLSQIHMQNCVQFNMMHHPMYRAGGSGSEPLANPKSKFKVVYLDGTETIVFSRIHVDQKKKCYLEQEEKKEKKGVALEPKAIYPGMTRYIEKLDATYQGGFDGIAADSCWLFRGIAGKVTAYSWLPVDPARVHLGYLTCLKKVDGPIVALTEENLTQALADNPKSAALVKKGKYVKAMKEYNKVAPAGAVAASPGPASPRKE